jgi:hypothetical protein
VVAGVGAAAVRHDFAASIERTLWFQVGVFGASFLLMLALPRGAGRRRPDESELSAGRDESTAPIVAATGR